MKSGDDGLSMLSIACPIWMMLPRSESYPWAKPRSRRAAPTAALASVALEALAVGAYFWFSATICGPSSSGASIAGTAATT